MHESLLWRIQGQIQRQIQRQHRTSHLIVLLSALLMTITLAACGRSSPANQSPTLTTSASTKTNDAQNAAMTLQPASGYGGLYVQVSGEQWPQNMMVLVTLEDDQGRSETLAASDTDQAGKLTTGFLFPIDQRWLDGNSLWVVTTTADGRIEAKAEFTIVSPGAEVAATSTSTSTADTVATSDKKSEAVTDTVAMLDKEAEHTLVLPFVSSAGVERGSNSRASRSSSSPTTSSGATQVDVDVDADGSIDCRNGDEWITVAIYSSGSFDATSVDPGSVVVSGGASDMGYGGDSTLTFAAYNSSARHAYQWRWNLEDADGDGSTDMVMEFRLDYTELTCDAAVVAVTGRTRDGKQFEGTNRVDMLVLERS